MGPLSTITLLIAASTAVQSLDIVLRSLPGLQANLEDNADGGHNIVLHRNSQREVLAVIGRGMDATTEVIQGRDVEMQFSNDTKVKVSTEAVSGIRNGFIITVTWEAPNNTRLEDCVNLGTKHWYGGPQQKRQYWPIEKLTLSEYSYVTKEADNCGIAEPYWLSSDGTFYYFDHKVPLFITQNVEENLICFVAETKPPYSDQRERNDLIYNIGIFEDSRIAHEYVVENYLGKPIAMPDERMIQYPIWSTWARYKRDIDHDLVLEFANEINNNGFPNSQFEIDDLWEICYGSQTVDERRFPNMSNTVDQLKQKGFRVTIWTHPFVNLGCEPWYSTALDAGYLVLSEAGSAVTSWWNDNGTTAAYIDFTKPAARQWYVSRLLDLKNSYGIDSFKFDAGETSWSPQVPVLQGDIYEQPSVITVDYVRQVSLFGPMVEVRAGYRTQDLPVFVRMIDKDTYWTFENGLPTLITTLLQMNMNGYGLVLPDMIGGNGYNEAPSKELFIRWLQANTFMPSLQFSYVPWDYDNETIEISKTFVNLHAEYTPQIVAACQRHVDEGAPVNPPIWWIAPDDITAQDIWDEYLLGDSILVAPVVTQNATFRDIYLPKGTWWEENDSTKVHEGPVWLRNYEAPLSKLPYFFRQAEDPEPTPAPDSGNTVYVSVLLIFSVFFMV